ncbi:MAG TPA: DUF3040 domain-containing protein [Motilibacteraceae bacterium]|nr:DUF3040 domain-containing protein [Motilibacteraceae bacterium]
MPLSEHEQRLLEQMERALYAEDPKFASALRGADPRTHRRRRIVQASIGFVIGLALLLTGVIVPFWAVGVLGFLVMLGSAFLVVSSWRTAPPAAGPRPVGAPGGRPAAPGRSGRPARVKSSGSFMERMEQRWNRRREQGPGAR